MTERSTRENLREWLRELISLFREELEKLSPEEQKVVSSTLEDLSEPCQILVIWAKKPEFQIVLITHLEGLKDRIIEIYGPIESSKLIEYIENKVLKSRLIKLAGRDHIENFLASALRQIQRLYDPLREPLKPFIDGKSRIGPSLPYVVGWIVIGNLQNFSVEKVVNNIIQSIKSHPKKPSPPPKKEKSILEGFGTYVYPPIWVGEAPKPRSFREKVIDPSFRIYKMKRVITETYKNRPLVVSKDGYIAIGENNKWKAQELLNEIMSVLLLRDIPVNMIREIDLGEVKLKETGGMFSWSPLSSRALLYDPFADRLVSMRRVPISEENIRKAIKLAELLTSDKRIKTLLLLYLEAYTHFQNTEYKQSLIMGWVILEDFYIKDLWTSHISKITSDEHRLSKLESWTIDQRLETLNISHVLTDKEFALLMSIKGARNEVVHEGGTPSREVVEECLKFVSRVIQEYIGKYIGMKFSEL